MNPSSELNSTLKEAASKIKTILLKSQCQIKHYLQLEQCISRVTFEKPSSAGIVTQSKWQYWSKLLSFTLQACLRERYRTKFDKRNNDINIILVTELEKGTFDRTPVYDVIVILGHSSLSNIGKFCTSDILAMLCHLQTQPSIIAFIGCCTGNNRHGPFVMVPHQCKLRTIFGFYQQRFYISELEKLALSWVYGITCVFLTYTEII